MKLSKQEKDDIITLLTHEIDYCEENGETDEVKYFKELVFKIYNM